MGLLELPIVCETGVRILSGVLCRSLERVAGLERVLALELVLILALVLKLVVESTQSALPACRLIGLELPLAIGCWKEITFCRNAAYVVAELLKMRIEKPCEFGRRESRELLNTADDVVARG